MSSIEKDSIDTQTTVVGVAAVTAWVIIFGFYLQGLLQSREMKLQHERAFTSPTTDGEQVKLTQESSLLEYRWMDQNAGTVKIPLDRAMDLVVKERSGN